MRKKARNICKEVAKMSILLEFNQLLFGFFRYPIVRGRLYCGLNFGEHVFYFPIVDGKIRMVADDKEIKPEECINLITQDEFSKFGLSFEMLKEVDERFIITSYQPSLEVVYWEMN
jgi:hypothetical protein